ncbi:MAG TPA: dockerin type I repeat-containing protein [bacterium]|nr:dockerin type I repeat-containing protein [bacterium]
MDGDGDLDAVVTNYEQGNRVWFNDGMGTFTDSGQSMGTFKSFGICLGDLDGDGDLDACEANYGQAAAEWINDIQPTPTPTHTPEPTATPTPTPPCFHTGDVNFSGGLTATDAQLAFFIVLGTFTPTWDEWCAADCNGSGSVTAADAQQIFYSVMGTDTCADPLN